MNYRLMWKDSGSGKDGCPALYDAGPDYYGVVGLDPAEAPADLAAGLAEGERLVLVPRNVLDRIPAEG